jgi:hypothetical protein
VKNYKKGLLYPLGEPDEKGDVPYAYYVFENTDYSSDQQIQTLPADDLEWTNRRPYGYIELW